jgi:hypothetical protein
MQIPQKLCAWLDPLFFVVDAHIEAADGALEENRIRGAQQGGQPLLELAPLVLAAHVRPVVEDLDRAVGEARPSDSEGN